LDWTSLAFSAAMAAVGVIVAAFAIFATVSERPFRAFLAERGLLTPILFPFWACGAFWVIVATWAGAIHMAITVIPKAVVTTALAIMLVAFGLALSLTLRLFPIIMETIRLQDLFSRQGHS
jgi:hypothetical protein